MAAAKANYEKVLNNWRDLIGKMRELQERFQVATSGEQTRLSVEYGQLMTKGNEMADLLPEAAERYYAAAPNQDREVAEFLAYKLNEDIQDDEYEDADRVAKLLLKYNPNEKSLYVKAGVAAFATNDFAGTRQYLQRASDLGEIDERGTHLLAEVDNYEKLWKHEQEIRKKEQEDDDLPRVKLTTTKGDIVVELFENEAPIATANFINLVEKRFYDGTKFHRVEAGFMAQGGDPLGNGTGGPGYFIPGEQDRKDHRIHFRGSLSMAHTGDPNTGGSQFFLTFNPTPPLNGKHTVFGRVIEGMDVLAKLQRTVGPHGEKSKLAADGILSATVLRKRNHAYEPEKLPAK